MSLRPIRMAGVRILAILISVSLLLVAVYIPQDVSAAGEKAVMGMPFEGKWAYNVLTGAKCGPNGGQTSHPFCHETYSGGNWSIDYYAGGGTDVVLRGSNQNDNITFKTSTLKSNQGCGQGLDVDVYVGSVRVGRMYMTHLANAAASRTIANGGKVGEINGRCYAGANHVHIEYTSLSGGYSCYVNYSRGGYTAGMTLHEGTPVGVLGAATGAPRTGCGIDVDGSFVQAKDTGRVYVMAGGAPMHVSSWSKVGGQRRIAYVRYQSEIDTMRKHPRDGTHINDPVTGRVYVTAGGAPMYISS